MLCPHCGSESPDEAPACPKCHYNFGVETAPAITTDTATQERQVRKLLIVAFLALVAAAIGWVVATRFKSGSSGTSAWHATAEVTQPLVATSVKLRPKQYAVYPFLLPPGFKQARVDGSFTVAAGSAGMVELLIFDPPSFVAWKNHQPTTSLYRSGRLRQGTLTVRLPVSSARYFLVINNGASPQAQNVQLDLKLHYSS